MPASMILFFLSASIDPVRNMVRAARMNLHLNVLNTDWEGEGRERPRRVETRSAETLEL